MPDGTMLSAPAAAPPRSSAISDEQATALRAARAWFAEAGGAGRRDTVAPAPHFCLAGFAGTGKSTLIPYLVDELGLARSAAGAADVVYVAPTGKAALVMTRKLRAAGGLSAGSAATTIHKAIYKPPLERGRSARDHDDEEAWLDKQLAGRAGLLFELSKDSPVRNAKLVICDEASMVGTDLAADLASFGVPIIAIGDPGQLPPVEEEAGFDMAAAARLAAAPGGTDSAAFLSEIHRQARDNPIIRLAHEIRNGGYPKHNGAAAGEALRVVKPGTLDIPDDPETFPAVIVGTHKRRWQLTEVIRQTLCFAETPLPRAGERVICCKNSRTLLELVNGAEGTMASDAQFDDWDQFTVVARVLDDQGEPLVQELDEDGLPAGQAAPIRAYRGLFDEHIERRRGAVEGPKKVAFFKQKELEHLDFGWAITCHKSQGTSWKDVVVIDESHVFRNEWKRWLYTATTRAEERLTIVTG